MPLKLIAHLAMASKFNWLSGHRTQLICLCLSLSILRWAFDISKFGVRPYSLHLYMRSYSNYIVDSDGRRLKGCYFISFSIPCLLFVCVILTMSSAQRRQHELSLPVQQIKYRETILAGCSSQSTLYPLLIEVQPFSLFVSSSHTL